MFALYHVERISNFMAPQDPFLLYSCRKHRFWQVGLFVLVFILGP